MDINQKLSGIERDFDVMKNDLDHIKTAQGEIRNTLEKIRDTLDRKVDQWVFATAIGASMAMLGGDMTMFYFLLEKMI